MIINCFIDIPFDQRNTLEKDYQLELKDYNRYVKLFEDKVITEQELERIQSYFLAKKLAFENSRSTLANLQIQISQLKSSIRELELQYKQQHETLTTTAIEAEQNMMTQIEIWEQRYVLRAPQNGNCVFTRFWANNQNINANETVFTILPDEHGAIKGTLQLPASGTGKLALNQK